MIKRLNVVELKNSLGEVLNRAEYQGERTVVHRRGKDAAAIIPVADLKLLETLLEEARDRADLEAARSALAESDERIPYEEFRRKQGLDDGPKARRSDPRTRSRTSAKTKK
jgi:prevent-host-death family protein